MVMQATEKRRETTSGQLEGREGEERPPTSGPLEAELSHLLSVGCIIVMLSSIVPSELKSSFKYSCGRQNITLVTPGGWEVTKVSVLYVELKYGNISICHSILSWIKIQKYVKQLSQSKISYCIN